MRCAAGESRFPGFRWRLSVVYGGLGRFVEGRQKLALRLTEIVGEPKIGKAAQGKSGRLEFLKQQKIKRLINACRVDWDAGTAVAFTLVSAAGLRQ